MSKTSGKRIIFLPTAAEDRKIMAAAKADPDAQPLSAPQMATMIPLRSVRGRPKLDISKQLVSIRYSPDVLAYFRSTGPGWQARMNAVLLDYVTRRRAPDRAAPERRRKRANP